MSNQLLVPDELYDYIVDAVIFNKPLPKIKFTKHAL